MHNAVETAITELEILSKNPTTKVRMKEKQVTNKSENIKCYDIDELESVLNYILNKRGSIKYYSLFTILSRTGLRIGECLALQWSDINFEKESSYQQNLAFNQKK